MLRKAGWLDLYSYESSLAFITSQALVHARLAGPYGEKVIDLINRRDWAGLLDCEHTYEFGQNSVHLIHYRQALGFFEKFEPLRLAGNETKTLKAFRRFAKSEIDCGKVNERFSNYRLGTPMGYPYDVILTDARRKIARILGPAPLLTDLKIGFGPGATTNVKKKDSCFRVKLGAQLECSNELAPLMPKLLATMPSLVMHHGKESHCKDEITDQYLEDGQIHLEYTRSTSYAVDFAVVPGRLQFVPKDAKKFRTITIEPGVNTLLQQGYGKWIRKRLQKAGINLDDNSRNIEGARLGSLFNELATIDFSMASDTIATQMVAFLLPDDWFTCLSMARTRQVEYEGLLINLEKFSTMGNSFTFELESLIFYSLAWAVLHYHHTPKVNLSIFGDDLVLPSSAVSLAELVFAFCGFTINRDKSFSNGPFRESCGSDFYCGIDIRPYYQKEQVSGETLFTLHNHYMRTGEVTLARELREKWIHPDLIIFGPDGYGDGHLIGDWTPQTRRIKLRYVDSKGRVTTRKLQSQGMLGWEGSYFKSYRHVKYVNTVPHHGDSLLPVYSIYIRGPGEDPDPQPTAPVSQELWADPKYFVVPGSRGYEVVSIYTLCQGIFVP